MIDRENVIKGFECCQKKVCIYDETLKECPYWELCGEYEDAFDDCTSALAQDALALLKAREPVAPVKRSFVVSGADEYLSTPPITVCGACGGWLSSAAPRANYCPHCGRAVKWE